MSGAELAGAVGRLAADAAADHLEVERMRAWLRALAALAGPAAIAMAERAIVSELWPAGVSDGHGARRDV